MNKQRNIQTQTTTQQMLPTFQLALVKLIEMSQADLEERVRDEMVDNEALEERDPSDVDDAPEAEAFDDDEYGVGEESGVEAAMADYRTADDVPDYLLARADASEREGTFQISDGQTFYENLQQQIGEYNLSDHERHLMDYLIGSLDEDGFLRKELTTLVDELAVYQNIDTTTAELEHLLSILQRFEPRGIGARNLQECLHLQLTDPDYRSPWQGAALAVVDRHFKLFVSKRWDQLRERLEVDKETFDHVLHELTHLNPTPGRALGEEMQTAAPTIVPDFTVTIAPDGEAIVTLNKDNIPELRVSQTYRETLAAFSKRQKELSREQQEIHTYTKKKVDDAQEFISLIEHRNRALLSVMQTIVKLQRPFFDDDDEQLLRPMVLKDVAEKLNFSKSTVSRVTGSKYVQTAYGVYPLKFFFSSQFTSEEGDDISNRQVKSALLEIVKQEDKKKPLSDEALAAALKEKGLPVARRTVTKYREKLGLPTARLRKE